MKLVMVGWPVRWTSLQVRWCLLPATHNNALENFTLDSLLHDHISWKQSFPQLNSCVCLLKMRRCVLLTHGYTFLKLSDACAWPLNIPLGYSELCSGATGLRLLETVCRCRVLVVPEHNSWKLRSTFVTPGYVAFLQQMGLSLWNMHCVPTPHDEICWKLVQSFWILTNMLS
jgi:hypothetical protein